MATKTTDSKKRGRKVAPIQPPAANAARQDVAAVSNAFPDNLEEQIRRRAYELYLERGSMPGDPSKDWLVAEQQVRSRQMQHAG